MIKGYKVLNNDLVCVLKIDPVLSDLKRTGVVDATYAKYICKKAEVIKIYSMKSNKNIEKYNKGSDNNFTYKVGKNVKTLGKDIEFFINKKAAIDWNNQLLCKKWYNNGQVEKEGTYKNKKLNGLYIEWYYDGRLKLKCNYLNGVLNGVYKSYYNNGNLKAERYYNKGIIFFYEKIWYFNGTLEKICKYVNGVRDGVFRSYHENGKLYVKCNFKMGILDGLYSVYDKKGFIVKKIAYINGKNFENDKSIKTLHCLYNIHIKE